MSEKIKMKKKFKRSKILIYYTDTGEREKSNSRNYQPKTHTLQRVAKNEKTRAERI